MQAGSSIEARALAQSAHQAICQWPSPSRLTLNNGIECLAKTDLREQVRSLSLPAQVISGLKDRVAKPESSGRLAEMLGADLRELDAGHAPFMTEPEVVLSALVDLMSGLDNEVFDEPR